MADHVRKAIRTAAVTDLTGLATTGSNVFTNRVSPLAESEMPGMYVMLRDERTSWNEAIGTIARTGNLVIEAWARGGDGLEDKLDTIAAEVEATLLDAASTLRGKIIDFEPPTTQLDLPEPEGGGTQRTGILRILFPVTYRTAIGDPTTIV